MSGKKAKPKRYERGYHPPSYYVWQDKHPRVVIYLTPEIKTQIAEIVEREKREQSKKTSLSKWCSEIVMSAFSEDRRREILGDAIIDELTRSAKAAADKYRDEKKREGDEYYKEITSEADEHHDHVVEFQDNYARRGYDRGLQEGLEKGMVRGAERAEREFREKLREAEAAREEAEEAVREAARKEEHERDKKQYNTLLDKNKKGFDDVLKQREKNCLARLKKVEEEYDEAFELRKSQLNAECKKKMKANYDKGHTDGWVLATDHYFDLGYKAGLKERGLIGGLFQRGNE